MSLPYHRSLIHLLLGERERSLKLLQKAYAINEGWLVWLGVEPQFDPLRGEPAFEELLSKTRNPAVSRTALRKVFPMRASAAAGQRVRAATTVSSPITSPASVAPETQASGNEEAQQLYTAGRYYATRRTAEGLTTGD